MIILTLLDKSLNFDVASTQLSFRTSVFTLRIQMCFQFKWWNISAQSNSTKALYFGALNFIYIFILYFYVSLSVSPTVFPE